MHTETEVQNGEHHIFTEEDTFQLKKASTESRFLNFIIDEAYMRYGLYLAVGALTDYLLLNLYPSIYYRNFYNENSLISILTNSLIYTVLYILYYVLCEKVFKGYTLGKLITGTRAIRQDGQELTLKDALLRTLSRLVPFEQFSAFNGFPWHDRWTKTMVIKSRF